MSVLKYYTVFDLLNDLRDKLRRQWQINILTKRSKELSAILTEENIQFDTQSGAGKGIVLVDATHLEHVPLSFQNPELGVQLLTDKEIFNLKRPLKPSKPKGGFGFLTGLQVGDLVVHLDHGIGRFGVVPREIDGIHREYLEIAYAENDPLVHSDRSGG
ncbi:hypothetical protein IPJ72_00030 [Candidatus Peregrinibacteria bacterium]|nr:MAG: hypothetical protein IPJ72_00030 [Candidatus Peregrinibacteria bacterium]